LTHFSVLTTKANILTAIFECFNRRCVHLNQNCPFSALMESFASSLSFPRKFTNSNNKIHIIYTFHFNVVNRNCAIL
jgi:hypothetical protein